MLGGAGRQRERVAPDPASRAHRRRRSLRERGQVALLVVGAPAEQRVDDERVLDVDEDADRGIDARQRLDRQHRVEERRPRRRAASGISMPMTPSSNSLSMSWRGNLGLLVHLADVRTDLAVGELVDAVAKQRFVLLKAVNPRRRHLRVARSYIGGMLEIATGGRNRR